MTHDAPLCAKCGRPLPVVMQRLYQGGPWTEVQNSVESADGNGEVCGWPVCVPIEPSELRKALQNLTDEVDNYIDGLEDPPVGVVYDLHLARLALAGDER